MERERPKVILDLIRSGESLSLSDDVTLPTLTSCERCGYISSQRLCKACLLLHGLNTGDMTVGISKVVQCST